MRLEDFFAEPSANFANGLKFLRVAVIAREQESAIDIRPLAFAIVTPDHHQIQRVANARKIVFLELQRGGQWARVRLRKTRRP